MKPGLDFRLFPGLEDFPIIFCGMLSAVCDRLLVIVLGVLQYGSTLQCSRVLYLEMLLLASFIRGHV